MLVLGVVLGLWGLGLVPARGLWLELAGPAGLACLDSLVGSEDIHARLPLPGNHLVVRMGHGSVECCLLHQVLCQLLHDVAQQGTSGGLRPLRNQHGDLRINL